MQELLNKRQKLLEEVDEETKKRKMNIDSFSTEFTGKIQTAEESIKTKEGQLKNLCVSNCTSNSKEITQLQEYVQKVDAVSDDLDGKVVKFLSEKQQSWKDHLTNVSKEINEHKSSITSNRQTTVEYLSTSEKEYTTSIEQLKTTETKYTTKFVESMNDHTKITDQQMQTITEYSQSESRELKTRTDDVVSFLQSELRKDLPTGKTPQRKDFLYPKKLVKTDDHDELLGKFRTEYKPDPLILNLTETLDMVAESESVQSGGQKSLPEGQENGTSDMKDDFSDTCSEYSCTSDTSGVSLSSAFSKSSESKENKPRKITAKPVSKKTKTNVARTPSGKSRLPLRNTTTEN